MASVGSSTARQVSYGATQTETTYWARNDFVNQTIADFLQGDCGVDAHYEVRAGSDNKFLWIYDVPFLFSQTTINTASGAWTRFYGPLYGTSLHSWPLRLFSGAATGVYNFNLYFCGDPSHGFALRLSSYNSSAPSYYFKFLFIKASNMLTGKDSVVWHPGVVSNSGTALNFIEGNGIDLNADGTLDAVTFSSDVVSVRPVLETKAVIRTSANGKFPLVPLTFGIWKTSGFYLHPQEFGLPAAQTTTTAAQTEISISQRKFIVTTLDSPLSQYINAGLIEVTGT